MGKRIIVEVMRAPRCLAIKLVWLGVVVVAAFTLLFIRPATRDDHTSVLWDPNAPVILVADDADGDTQPHHKRLVDRSHISVNESTVWTGHHGLQQTGSSRAKLFLLYAFPHGGGGLASEAIFNVHPNQVFFLHQPLHQLPSTIFHLKSPGEWVQLVLNCSLGIAGHLLHQPHLWKSSSFRLTHASHCRPHQMDMAMCVAMACQRRNFRAVFTSQLAMEEIEELLNVYQYLLKIVVMVRDPRALLAAGLRSHPRLSPHQLELQANKICFTMAARISSARSLQHRFPSSVLVLHHEHLVSRPAHVLDAVNQFLGLRVSRRRLAATLALLGLDIPEQERLQLVNMWQLDFTLQEVRQVDKSCSRYYHDLDYLPVPHTITTNTNFFIPWLDAKL